MQTKNKIVVRCPECGAFKKGFTLCDSGSIEMRKQRIKFLENEIVRIWDIIGILEHEIKEMKDNDKTKRDPTKMCRL